MANFELPKDPVFNINNVTKVEPTDRIFYSFINGYYQNFLQNDQYLNGRIDQIQLDFGSLKVDTNKQSDDIAYRMTQLEQNDSNRKDQFEVLTASDNRQNEQIKQLQDVDDTYRKTLLKDITYDHGTVTMRKGDDTPSTFQITKESLGIENVDNTHDKDKTVATAGKLTKPVKISLSGAATGSTTFDGSGNTDLHVDRIDSTKIDGIIPIANIPKTALERLVIVENEKGRLALNKDDIQNGDTVQQTDTGRMFYVVDDTKLGTPAAFHEYTAGSSTSAVNDSAGQNIAVTYLKDLSVDGSQITLTHGDGDIDYVEMTLATEEKAGLLSPADKANIDNFVANLGPGLKVANNCTTVDTGYVLDARQGKALSDKIDQTAESLSNTMSSDKQELTNLINQTSTNLENSINDHVQGCTDADINTALSYFN